MTYLVFDARKALGYLFETRHKWLAHLFCVMADKLTRGYTWDYSPTMDFDGGYVTTEADWHIEPMSEEEFNWSEKYHGA